MSTDTDHEGTQPSSLLATKRDQEPVLVAASESEGMEEDDLATKTVGDAVRRAITVLEPGTQIGRYRLEGLIGTGGMGVVYEAFDPQLERRVALKLLSVEGTADEGTVGRRARMLREALALARLSHPNIVAVYDAGEVEAGVFIAMEYIRGQTIDQWVRAEKRSLDDLIRIFVAAGEGLAAAHGAKLLHRDFKPQNVMVGSDGRTRVIDFGLARRPQGTVSLPPAARADAPSGLAMGMTEVGAVSGTPRYMSPEQRSGAVLDARSDQYSFCASLQEMALYVAMTGDSNPNATEDEVLPRWLRQALARGLSTSPSARFPDMDTLLAELRRDRRMGLTRVAVGVALLVAVASVTWLGARQDPAEACRRGAEVGAWSKNVREATRAALTAKGGAVASAFATIDPLLASFDRAWSDSYAGACDDTHVKFTQSPALFDQRMSCLSRKRQQVAGLIRSIAEEADKRQLTASVGALARISSVEACSKTALLSDEPPLPKDEKARRLADRGFRSVDTAESMFYAGRFKEADEAAKQAERDGDSSHHAPLVATALLFQAAARDKLGQYPAALDLVRKSLRSARSSSAKRLETRGFITLASILGRGMHSFERAEDAAFSADLGLSQLPETDELRAEYALKMSKVYVHKSDYPTAQTMATQAVAFYRARGPQSAVKLADSLLALSGALIESGKYPEARQVLDEALGILRPKFGASHPDVSGVLMNLGAAAWYAGDLGAAAKFFEQAEQGFIHTMGENHIEVGKASLNRALVLLGQDRLDEAEAAAQRALKIIVAVHGENHMMAAVIRGTLGNIEMARDHYPAAVTQFESALATFERSDSAATLMAHEVGFSFGKAALAHGDLTLSSKLLRQAEAGYLKLVGTEHVLYATVTALLAELAYQERRFSDARKLSMTVIDRSSQKDASWSGPLARTSFVMARLAQGDAQEGSTFAHKALDSLKDSHDPESESLRREVKQWLATR